MSANEQRDFDRTIVADCEESSSSGHSAQAEVCPRCGQSFDTRVLRQVVYHNQPDREPIVPHG